MIEEVKTEVQIEGEFAATLKILALIIQKDSTKLLEVQVMIFCILIQNLD